MVDALKSAKDIQ
jgi:hypothetical protein